MNTLQTSINWSQAFVNYPPLTAGTGSEPAISTASMVRNTILNAPFTWPENRSENSSTSTVVGTQDYTIPITDFGFIEKVSLTDNNGSVTEMKYVHNTAVLSVSSTQQRPDSACVVLSTLGTSIKLRFMGVPDKIYLITVTYQRASVQFNSFAVTAAANASAGNTVYTGTFSVNSFPIGTPSLVAGFSTSANNGTFLIVAVTTTALTLANPSGVTESATATAINESWFPIPDNFSDIYNNLFLAEVFSITDDARAASYRQRGVAALLSKAEGLSEMQINAFLAQSNIKNSQQLAAQGKTQQGVSARGI